jgi:conjugative transposon TraM protein
MENSSGENKKREVKSKKELSAAALQKRKKRVVFPLFFLLFAGAMWLIFAPSQKDKEKEAQGAGFNAQIPDPKNQGIISDKRDAYRMEEMTHKEEEKRRNLQDFSILFAENREAKKDVPLLSGTGNYSSGTSSGGGTSGRSSPSIASSADAYRKVNTQVRQWYDEPIVEPDEQAGLALEWRIEELERKQQESETALGSADRQLELIEKSYRLAAKYAAPGQGQTQAVVNAGADGGEEKEEKPSSSPAGKTQLVPLRTLEAEAVSGLFESQTNGEFIRQVAEVENWGFLDAWEQGAVGRDGLNTVQAVVHTDQSVAGGGSVRLRLTGSLLAGKTLIPAHTLVTGHAAIVGERMEITVSSLEYEGMIFPVSMVAYDTDGQKGIYIPGSMELDAAKEIAANMGTAAGTSLSITQNAGQQIAADLTRGLVQGSSQYMAKKVRQAKVSLKAGYCLYLLPLASN